MTNPFVIHNGSGTVGTPSRFYGLAQQIELLPDSLFLQFDLIGADWFDTNGALVEGSWSKLDTRRKFFDAAPLFALETNALATEWVPVWNRVLGGGKNDVAGILAALESIWVEIELTDEGGAPVLLYRNLFGQGEKWNLKSIRPASLKAIGMLNATDPLGPEPDATDVDVQDLLSSVSVGDFVSVYEVGQGNMNGLCDSLGKPQLFYDFGGGVLGNARTFPVTFTSACFAADPLIVLSHWDMDHWSSANRFTQAWRRTWIAPRQSPLGKSHGALITDILTYGQLIIWNPASGSVRSGRLELVVCGGPGRNHSGLALYVSAPPSMSRNDVLLPGDAAYAYVPKAITATLHALVAAHHGGTLVASGIPSSAGIGDSRLAYSFGAKNTYGHPTSISRRDHDSMGWEDTTANPSRARDLVRESTSGHLSVHWTTPAAVPSVHCSTCPSSCSLQIVQT